MAACVCVNIQYYKFTMMFISKNKIRQRSILGECHHIHSILTFIDFNNKFLLMGISKPIVPNKGEAIHQFIND